MVVASTSDRPQFEPIVLPWETGFVPMFYDAHELGEHVALVGPNGTGKTMCGLELCRLIGAHLMSDRRPTRVTVLQYKPRDDTVRKIIPDWPIVKKWPPHYGEEHVVVWPKASNASSAARLHRQVFLPLLDRIYVEGNQAVYVPEAAYFERALPAGLSMAGTMEQFWSTARSSELTMISDTQRPRMVTNLMWTEPAWVFIYKMESKDDIKRVAELSGEFGDTVLTYIPQLGPHEFLCIRRQRTERGDKQVYISKVALVTRNKRN